MTALDPFDSSILPLLWGRNGRTSSFPRIVTPAEHVAETIQRGGFPLFRKDNCGTMLAPMGSSVHASLEKILFTGAAIRPRV